MVFGPCPGVSYVAEDKACRMAYLSLCTHFLAPCLQSFHSHLASFFYSSAGEGGHQRRVPGRPLREPGVSIWHRIIAAGHATQRWLHRWAEELDADDGSLLGGAATRPLDPPGEREALERRFICGTFRHSNINLKTHSTHQNTHSCSRWSQW